MLVFGAWRQQQFSSREVLTITLLQELMHIIWLHAPEQLKAVEQ
jgi:hypothetical protein